MYIIEKMRSASNELSIVEPATLVGRSCDSLRFNFLDEKLVPLDKIESLQYKATSLATPLDETLYLSIKQVGLQSPLVVAKPPGCEKYVLVAGGNSRLQALQRLVEETGNDSYSQVPCVISTWPGEFQACLAHIITNDVRIQAGFVERAQDLLHVLSTVGTDRAGKSLSQRDAAKMLTENGYPISQTTLNYMEYAVQRLVPHLDSSIIGELGLADVRNIRNFEVIAKKLSCGRGTTSECFEKMFEGALKSIDSPCWDFDYFVDQLEERIAKALPNKDGEFRELVDGPIVTVSPDLETSFEADHDEFVQQEVVQKGSQFDARFADKDSTLIPDAPEKALTSAQKDHSLTGTIESSTPSLRRLRGRAFELSKRLCTLLDMNKGVVLEIEVGCGFQVVHQPDDQWKPVQLKVLSYLKAFSNFEHRNNRKPTNEEMNPIEDEQSHNLVGQSPQSKFPAEKFHSIDVRLWAELNDQAWSTLTELWDTVRALHGNATGKLY